MNYIVNPFTGKFDAIGNDTDYWSKSTNQTGLTGDKSGSFDLTTTGIIQADQIGIGGGSSFPYIFGVHTDDDNPYLAGFFNDTFSTTVPVFECFGWSSTSGDFVAGDFEMGSPTANKVAIYTNGYTNPRLIIYGDGTAEFTNNLTTVGITASGIIRANLGSIIKAGQKLVLDGG